MNNTCCKGIESCYCKTGWPYEKQCPDCRDNWDKDEFRNSYCICGPKPIIYKLYQIQLENRDKIYSLEVPTNDFDAVDRAKIYINSRYNDYGPFYLGGYDEIGSSNVITITDNTKDKINE